MVGEIGGNLPSMGIDVYCRWIRFSDGKDFYAWKGYDFDILNSLDDKDYIRQGERPSRRKSVYLTETGIDYAKELLEKYGIKDWD